MNVPVKLSLFGLGLVVVLASAFGAGKLAGPLTATAGGGHGDVHATPVPSGAATTELPGGLQVAQDGYRLAPQSRELSASAPLRFTVFGPDGKPVTAYTTTHDKDLHLIVVRRDLTGFQHVHPVLGEGGVWSVPIQVAAPGPYRMFADFQPTGRDTNLILGADIAAPGDYRPQTLPAASRTSLVDGYTVTLDGDLVPGTASKLTLLVAKDGRPVTDLQPYLAAYGHLVALRDGDLAYLHVHPDGAPGDGRTAAGPQIVFYAEVPSSGDYRLFLDFQHNGTVRTAQFTVSAGGSAPPQPAVSPSAPAHGGHGS